MVELKILKDFEITIEDQLDGDSFSGFHDVALIRKLKEDAIKQIKHLRRPDRMNIYQKSIEEKSLIPWMMRYFGITEKELK